MLRETPTSARVALRPLAVLLVLGCAAGGCATDPLQEPEQLDVEVIDAGPTANLGRFAEGERDGAGPSGKTPPAALVGLLPGSFPSDLPVFEGASVLDYQLGKPGERSVVLGTQSPKGNIESWIKTRLPAAGWSSSRGSWQKGNQVVEISVHETAGGTEVHYTY